MANILRNISQVCGLTNNEADGTHQATSRYNQQAKSIGDKSTTIGVGKTGNEKGPMSIDRLDQIRTADAVPSTLEVCLLIGSIRLGQPMRCHRL
jgi:hypothetical protein